MSETLGYFWEIKLKFGRQIVEELVGGIVDNPVFNGWRSDSKPIFGEDYSSLEFIEDDHGKLLQRKSIPIDAFFSDGLKSIRSPEQHISDILKFGA